MLMIMGLGAQMIHWDDDFCEMLAARGYRVIRFDNRDIGKSTRMSGGKRLTAVELLKLRFRRAALEIARQDFVHGGDQCGVARREALLHQIGLFAE